MIRVVAAPWVLTGFPEVEAYAGTPAAIPDGAVALDGDRVVAVDRAAALAARFGRPERIDAVILPALVNAHLHLELSHLAGAVPGGDGLPAWIERFVRARRELEGGEAGPGDQTGTPSAAPSPEDAGAAMTRAAGELVRAGVAAVGDVSNTLASLEALRAAGLAGTVFHEVFGVTPARLAAAREQAARARAAAAVQGAAAPGAPAATGAAASAGLRVVESPHAVYSTDPGGLAELLAGPPASIHLAEDPAEREFVATGGGPLGALRVRMGGAAGRPGWARSPVALAAPRLRPGWLLVHCVDLDAEDLAALRACGATVVLCPRSNAFISGARPPLPSLLAAGVPLAVGTDSLASSPSLAPLAELAALRAAFPEVPGRRLLPLAWNGAAVSAPAVGRLAPGTAPGVLAAPLGGARPADPFDFLAGGEGPLGRPVGWLARHRPEVLPS